MTNINIRPIIAADLAELVNFDHSYHTDHVWQMNIKSDEEMVGVSFRQVKLPRSMRVDYPNDPWKLTDIWQEEGPIFVAETRGEKPEVIGYLRLTLNKFPNSVWVSDFLVLRRLRRQMVGSRLLVEAQNWARSKDFQRIIIEMQSKNYPVSCLVNKLGYEFCGYSDQYYFNQDIAMFYCRRL